VVRLTWRTLGFSLALALLVPLGLKAASVDRDLEGIKKKIEKEKQGISQTEKKEGSILQSLGKIEEDWQRKTRELKDANAKLDSISTEIQRKEAEAEKIKNSMRNRQELLQRRAAALYRWYRSGSPFVILNGDVSLTAFLQRKHYLETTVSYDRELVEKLSEQAQRHEVLREELARKKVELSDQ